VEETNTSNPDLKFCHNHIISENPKTAIEQYVDIFGANVTCEREIVDTPQIDVDMDSVTILIFDQRPGQTAAANKPIRDIQD
jgi:hypothetical protein